MTDNTVVSLNTPQDPLTELIRQGARDLIAQAVEAELQQLLAQHQNVMVDGKQAIVRNGFLPERTYRLVSVMSKFSSPRSVIAQVMVLNLIAV